MHTGVITRTTPDGLFVDHAGAGDLYAKKSDCSAGLQFAWAALRRGDLLSYDLHERDVFDMRAVNVRRGG